VSTPLIYDLAACADMEASVGGKATGLGRLLALNLPVPPGFAVTVSAYRAAIKAAGLAQRIDGLLGSAVDKRTDREVSESIRSLFTEDILPDEVRTAIDQAYAGLGPDTLVAVRSSATAEDLADASFAGQQDTYLAIRGARSVCGHVIRCWSSLFTPHAIAYRRRFNVPVDGLAMGVVVQTLIPAEAAGVMMTIEPVHGDRSTIYIEAAYGLGEGVVRGDVGTDRFWIEKRELEVSRRDIGDKAKAHVLNTYSGLVELTNVDQRRQSEQCLKDAEIVAVARLGREVEDAFGKPVDIEWAIGPVRRELFLLQARPETVWSNRDPQDGDRPDPDDPTDTFTVAGLHWTRANVGEAMPGVQTPLSWTLWAGGVERALREAAFAVGALTRAERTVPADRACRFIRIFRGRVAVSVEFLTMIGDRMPGTTGEETARNLFGSVPTDIDYAPTRRRYPFVAWRLPRTFMRMPHMLQVFAAETDQWYRLVIPGCGNLGAPAARTLFAEAQHRFNQALEIQTISVLAVIQPLYTALGKLVERSGAGEIGVLSGTGGAEMAVVADIWKAAKGRIPLERVTANHGFHGPTEGELSSRVWREDPAPLTMLLERYAGREDPVRADDRRRVRDMQRDVLAGLPRHVRPAARVLLRLCETHLQSRGVIKRSFLQCFDVARAAARRLGEIHHQAGVLDDPEHVFYLTVDELLGELPSDARAVIAKRRSLRERHERFDMPSAWAGRPRANRAAPSDEAVVDSLTGTGVSAGIVEGLARVVTDPSFDDVEDGDILVACTTDPSWSSIMYVSAGLVVDIGGALSHAAVVAREMGIPCVVSTGEGTRRLHTGDRIRVDGNTGRVDILARADGAHPTPQGV
jgi:rifampicin phosphotransferase